MVISSETVVDAAADAFHCQSMRFGFKERSTARAVLTFNSFYLNIGTVRIYPLAN